MVDRNAFNHRVRTGKIDIFKDAEGTRLSAEPAVRNHTVLSENDDLPGINIPDQFGTDGIQGTGLGRNHPGTVCGPAAAERPETVGIPEGNELGGSHERTGISAQELLHGPENRFFRGGYLQALGNDGIDDGFGIGGAMEDAAVQLMLCTQGTGVDQVAVVAQGQVSLHMADDDGLDVVVVFSAGGGVADVADGDISLAETVKALPVKHFADQAVPFVMAEYAVAGNRDAAAFLPPVLQGIQAKVDFPGYRPFFRGPDTENAAFLMHTRLPPKKEKRPPARAEGRLCPLICELYRRPAGLSIDPIVLLRHRIVNGNAPAGSRPGHEERA